MSNKIEIPTPPRYVVMIIRKSSIIIDPNQKESPPILAAVVHDSKSVKDFRSQNPNGDMFIFPISQKAILSLEELEEFEKSLIIQQFDINKLADLVHKTVSATFEQFAELSTSEKQILSIKSIHRILNDGDIDLDEKSLDFNITYREDGSLGQMLPKNMYSFLTMYGVPVKSSDVVGLKEFHMPYGIFAFNESNQPLFNSYNGK